MYRRQDRSLNTKLAMRIRRPGKKEKYTELAHIGKVRNEHSATGKTNYYWYNYKRVQINPITGLEGP